LAYLLGACATGTPEPTPTPQATVEPSTTTGTEHTLGAGSGWPEGTQDLRTVIFRVTVSGDAKRALSSGDEGYLIIHRIKKNEWAKLIFTNGVRAVYEMPADAYKIVEIGPFTCRNNDFSLPVEPDTEAQINFDIQIFVGKKELQLYLPRRPSNKGPSWTKE
jgi:hypothetical protein